MTMFNAYIEVHEPADESRADELMERLAAYHPAVGGSPRGWLSAHISLPAENLQQATSTAIAVVETATGSPAIAAEVMLESEFDARQGFVPVPELVSVTEAAELLGVSRVRVNQMIDERKFTTATKVGNTYAIARTDVLAKCTDARLPSAAETEAANLEGIRARS